MPVELQYKEGAILTNFSFQFELMYLAGLLTRLIVKVRAKYHVDVAIQLHLDFQSVINATQKSASGSPGVGSGLCVRLILPAGRKCEEHQNRKIGQSCFLHRVHFASME